MSKLALFLACVAAACHVSACAVIAPAPQDPAPAAPSRSPFSFQIGLGLRDMHGEAWDGLEEQFAFDMAGIYAPAEWPVALEGGFSFDTAYGDVRGNDRYSNTFELSGGARKELPLGEDFSLILGAGVFVAYTTDMDYNDALDVAAWDGDGWGGVYAHGGLFVRLDEALRLGFDVRMADGSDPDIAGSDRSGDYTQYALALIVDL
jgi:hypothetical protein